LRNVVLGQQLFLYLIAINVMAFLLYGIDKWKAKHKQWRVPEATLLGVALIGGSIGALLGMMVWRHKTKHKKFTIGLPLILAAQIALILLTACGTAKKAELQAPVPVAEKVVGEHSETTFLVMYDSEVGKEPLLKAVKDLDAEVIYDYHTIAGMTIKKPNDRTLEETMEYFRTVKGVLTVEYDRIIRLTDPVKPQLEVR